MILPVAHPARVSWTHARAHAPRRAWVSLATPVDVPEGPEAGFRLLHRADDGTAYHDRDGALWTPLAGTGGRLDRAEAEAFLRGAVARGTERSLHGTPLIAADDPGHARLGTRGSPDEVVSAAWGGGWRRVDGPLDPSRKALADFVTDALVLTEAGAYVRSEGPMLAWFGRTVLMTSPRTTWTSALGCDVHDVPRYLAHRAAHERGDPLGDGIGQAASAAAAIDPALTRGHDFHRIVVGLARETAAIVVHKAPGRRFEGLAPFPGLSADAADIVEAAERSRLGGIGVCEAPSVLATARRIALALSDLGPALSRGRVPESWLSALSYAADLASARGLAADEEADYGSLSALVPG